MAELTRIGIAGLDGLTRADVEREHRGAVYQAEAHLRRALEGGNAQLIAYARANLAGCYRRARAERVAPYWHGAP